MASMAASAAIGMENGMSSQLYDRTELFPGRLDFALVPSAAPAGTEGAFTLPQQNTGNIEEFVSMDSDLGYARFFADFGPLHLGRTVCFCRELEKRLGASVAADPSKRRIVLYCSDHPHKRANAMTLLAIFLVMVGGFKPELAVSRMLKDGKLKPPFGFRDATCGVCTFFITLLDCARAVRRALDTSLLNYQNFSLAEYDHFNLLENGDCNWIVPGKLLAFSGPQRERILLDASSGATTLLARDYAALFRSIGVTCVIRFNEASTYDRKAFIQTGLRHIDMPFPDGSNPSDDILSKFIRICERESGGVAIHCKAGLGRTGTAIAAYLMKNYRFSANEAIAWCRICRPGSILGPQQHFLAVKQPELLALPSIFEVQPVNKPQSAANQSRQKRTSTKLQRLPSQQRQYPVSR